MSTALAVVAAMRIEGLAIRRGLAGGLVLRCGMGASRLDAVLDRLAGSTAVAVVGVAGAVDRSLKPGDIVVTSEVRDAEGSIELPAAAPLVADLRARGFTVHHGPVHSSTAIVHGDRRADVAESGAIAVDMESAQVLRAVLARRPETAVAAIRVIVDTPDKPLLSPATLRSGARALRTLAELGQPLRSWEALSMRRRVLLAAPRSFCAGVERAIDIVERALDQYPAPIYVRRQIVHNAHVVAELEKRGAVFVHELDEVPDAATVVLSAHGVAPAVRTEAARRGMLVIDATCPLVAKVHAEARRFVSRGDSVVLIGHHNHDETEGTLGEAPGKVLLVESADQVADLQVPDPSRVAYVTQTTLATDEAEEVAVALRSRFPEIEQPATEDICYATTNRQSAVRAIAAESEVILVVGSQNSSNSKRLVEVAQRSGTRAHLIEDVAGIRPEWISGASSIGLTAGASTPPHLVDQVMNTLRSLGPVDLTTVSVAREEVTFTLPKEVDN